MSENKIIIAEDESVIRSLYEGSLSVIPGLALEFVENGEDLVQRVVADPTYRVVITDYSMGQMTGLEASTRIRAGGYSGPIILCSANEFTEDMLNQMLSEGIDHVKKPFSPLDLSAKVTSYITTDG